MDVKLSKKDINIVQGSSELITSNDTKITKRMYEILFNRYPDTKILFINAPEDQYMKLAEALSAYTINIDRLHILKPALQMISRSHVFANVRPADYIKVGSALIDSMEEVIGEKASPEFLDAWREAYKHIANILIEMEKDLYKEK